MPNPHLLARPLTLPWDNAMRKAAALIIGRQRGGMTGGLTWGSALWGTWRTGTSSRLLQTGRCAVRCLVAPRAKQDQVVFIPRQIRRYSGIHDVVEFRMLGLYAAKHAGPATLQSLLRLQFSPPSAVQVAPLTAALPVEMRWPGNRRPVGVVARSLAELCRVTRTSDKVLSTLDTLPYPQLLLRMGLSGIQRLATNGTTGLLRAVRPALKWRTADDASDRQFWHTSLYKNYGAFVRDN